MIPRGQAPLLAPPVGSVGEKEVRRRQRANRSRHKDVKGGEEGVEGAGQGERRKRRSRDRTEETQCAWAGDQEEEEEEEDEKERRGGS
eukprot:3429412-Rhodomonas_salina.2